MVISWGYHCRILGLFTIDMLDTLGDVLFVFFVIFFVEVPGLKKIAPPKPPRPSLLRKKNLAANQTKGELVIL